jgi:hypothetical protein
VNSEQVAHDDRRKFTGHAEQGRVAGCEGGQAVLRELCRQAARASRAAGETARKKQLQVLAVGQGSHSRAFPALSDLSFDENLTDGLDGLAAGASVMVFGGYTFIGLWQFQKSCANAMTMTDPASCMEVRDPLDLAVIASALMGACFGFLWWNTSPAKIFMGEAGQRPGPWCWPAG